MATQSVAGPENAETQYLSRSTDHLGSLQRTLRDLVGYRTLANELIQNADDAGAANEAYRASAISFDVRQHELIVENDGRFSDCGSVKERLCPWKLERGSKCDFHRFRTVAGGDKRNEIAATGAFGIGFTAVYQITDRPELISGGRHWIVDELAEESQRIIVCPGCAQCRDPNVPNTRFVLPFASSPDSPLRRELQFTPFGEAHRAELIHELDTVLPDSLLFLKSVSTLTLRIEGSDRITLQRLKEDDTLLVADGSGTVRTWYRLDDEFDEEADSLKKKFPQIEARRKSIVSIAFSDEVAGAGLLYACLPTQMRTGLPFHINADFFPSSNRKDIVLEADYQSDWNRAALRAAARLLARQFGRIRSRLTAEQLWKFIEAVFATSKEVAQKRQDHALLAFWDQLLPVLQSEPIILTTSEAFVSPAGACIEYSRRQRDFVPVFEAVGLATPHDSIWSRVAEIQMRNALGVATLNTARLFKAFEQKGLTAPVEMSQVPPLFRTPDGLALAWDCVDALLTEKTSEQERRNLRSLALVPCVDGMLRPSSVVLRADESTVELFRCLDETQPFHVDTGSTPKALLTLVPLFSVGEAVSALERLSANDLSARLGGDLDVRLLRWFANRGPELGNRQIRCRIAALPIFPSASGWLPLNELALPGDFKDELSLANLLDMNRLAGLRDFLVDLGAEELTFLRYVRLYLPSAFQAQPTSETTEKRLRAVELLAERMGALEDDITKSTLQKVPIIKCTDGVFRLPADVYLANQLNLTILGPGIHRAAWSKDSPLRSSVARLYRWLGVSAAPRDEDLARRVKSLEVPSESSREVIRLIVKHLHETTDGDLSRLEGTLGCLRTVGWLPAKGDETRWYSPSELYLEYRSYLFSSQAQFIDLPKTFQTEYSRLLQALGVRSEPDAGMVVHHLIHCVENSSEVNEEIYAFLNRFAADPRVRSLQSKPCIAIPGRGVFRPDQVFWSEHPFGTYRQQLSHSLRKFSDLFSALGVRERPTASDARKVILEIAQVKGSTHTGLGSDYDIVMNCWRLLSKAQEEGVDTEPEIRLLRNREVVPDAGAVLWKPSLLYFDDRVGLKARFGRYLERNLIPRPTGADTALQLAGVRSINDVVEAQLTHVPQATAGIDLRQYIVDRISQIKRLLAFHDVRAEQSTEKIGAIEFRCVEEIRVRYLAYVFELNEPVPSEEEHLQAHFDGNSTFYFVGGGPLAWREISKELALLFCPEREPGVLAASLKEVLASSSVLEAEQCLNDLGFPQETVSITDVPGLPPVEQLGGTAGASAPRPANTGNQSGGPGPLADSSGVHESIGSGSSIVSPSGTSGARHAQPQSRLPVYVGAVNGKSTTTDSEARDRLVEVDRRGIMLVLQAEREAGRQPELMPHNYPGYDIEARNREGEIERLIEVKSTSTAWRDRGVAMSREQFNHAEDASIKYWLYVVEKALDEDYVIHRIQNPAKLANEFVYDGGWKVLASD